MIFTKDYIKQKLLLQKYNAFIVYIDVINNSPFINVINKYFSISIYEKNFRKQENYIVIFLKYTFFNNSSSCGHCGLALYSNRNIKLDLNNYLIDNSIIYSLIFNTSDYQEIDKFLYNIIEYGEYFKPASKMYLPKKLDKSI
jgi:hypothetical protein